MSEWKNEKKLDKRLLESEIRLRIAQTYQKDTFSIKENVFETIYRKNCWKSIESHSGEGSDLSTTTEIRKQLPLIWKKYNVKSVLDVPCGDFNWMNAVDKKGIEYIGGDIIEELIKRNKELYGSLEIKFEKIDITKDPLPQADMIFCKDCLQHLSYENIRKALQNFKRSGAKYLMLTSYPLTLKNHDILDGDYRALNLLIDPFNLPVNYIYKVGEKPGKGVEIDKTMYLWKISDCMGLSL